MRLRSTRWSDGHCLARINDSFFASRSRNLARLFFRRRFSRTSTRPVKIHGQRKRERDGEREREWPCPRENCADGKRDGTMGKNEETTGDKELTTISRRSKNGIRPPTDAKSISIYWLTFARRFSPISELPCRPIEILFRISRRHVPDGRSLTGWVKEFHSLK